MKVKHIIILLVVGCVSLAGRAPLSAQSVVLSLDRTITIAADSSLESFRSKNLYLSSYWQYRSYRAARLPSLSMILTPAQYNRDIVRRYDSDQDIDIFRQQQSFYAGGTLSVVQNFDLLGGTFYMDSQLGYIRNFGATTNTQFTSVPFRIGYSQSLLGYNPFKWERRIEPIKYEKAKKQLLFNLQYISELATSEFFDLAMAQSEYDLAKANLTSSDTLYQTGLKRQEIAAISQSDLLTLKLDAVNARNSFQNAEIALKRAMFSLATFLNLDKGTEIKLNLPSRPSNLEITVAEALNYARENNPTILGLKQSVLEAEQEVDKKRKEAMFNASISASVGFNQVADNFSNAYKDPLRQDIVGLTVSIPLVDWGVRRGRLNMAKNNLNVTKIEAEQTELTVEEDLIITVGDFLVQQKLIESAEEALDLASMAYDQTKKRFLIGKADLNSLTLSLNRQQESQRNYISSLRNYWMNYYKIRKLTLHDFVYDHSLVDMFDFGIDNL